MYRQSKATLESFYYTVFPALINSKVTLYCGGKTDYGISNARKNIFTKPITQKNVMNSIEIKLHMISMRLNRQYSGLLDYLHRNLLIAGYMFRIPEKMCLTAIN